MAKQTEVSEKGEKSEGRLSARVTHDAMFLRQPSKLSADLFFYDKT